MNQLFRGKSIRAGKWTYGSIVQDKDKSFICTGTFHGIMEVNPETVSQFTGLYSFVFDTISIETKAFYGDIIRYATTEGTVFIKHLWWSEELQSTMIGNFPYYRLHESAFIQPSRLQFEIIGNIIDNPELLEND